MHRSFLVLMIGALAASAATAAPPSPIDSKLFSFPGSLAHPPSAVSAGLALADAWLGDEPFSNPASPRREGVILAPALLRVNRQDLRAANRNYDEQAVFLDGAGAALGAPYVPVWIYAYQPALRLEDYAFNRGTGTDPTVPPAAFSGQAEIRETRAGVAVSAGLGRWRAGAAVEWTGRDDLYRTQEQSGDPAQGERETRFDGSGVGGTFGLRFDSADSGSGRWTVGLAARYLPAIEVEGQERLDLLTGSSVTPVAAEREAGWEGGLSGRYAVTEAFQVLAAAGGRAEQSWEGFGVTSGAIATWRLAVQFHDARDPWTMRFGLGQDQQSDVPEPRAGVVGLGIGWDIEGAVLDLGVLHRGVERSNAPTSYDDRVVASVRVGF